MILGETGREAVPGPRRPADTRSEVSAELRKMALHLETASVLDARAARTADPMQVAVLRRRASQRRQEAARIRGRLAARGFALRDRRTPADG